MIWEPSYEFCKLCGEPLSGSKQWIGVCSGCMFDSVQPKKTTAPKYGFQTPIEIGEVTGDDENEVPAEAG